MSWARQPSRGGRLRGGVPRATLRRSGRLAFRAGQVVSSLSHFGRELQHELRHWRCSSWSLRYYLPTEDIIGGGCPDGCARALMRGARLGTAQRPQQLGHGELRSGNQAPRCRWSSTDQTRPPPPSCKFAANLLLLFLLQHPPFHTSIHLNVPLPAHCFHKAARHRLWAILSRAKLRRCLCTRGLSWFHGSARKCAETPSFGSALGCCCARRGPPTSTPLPQSHRWIRPLSAPCGSASQQHGTPCRSPRDVQSELPLTACDSRLPQPPRLPLPNMPSRSGSTRSSHLRGMQS